MAVPVPLYKQLRDALGPEAGDVLMTWLEQVRADNDAFRTTIRADLAEFRSEVVAAIQASEARLADRIEMRLDARIASVQTQVAEVKADLMKWSFVFWVGAVGAIALLAGMLDR